MAIATCLLALLCPPPHGGHAVAVPPPRGGEAVPYVDPIPDWTMPDWICIHNHEAAWNDPDDPYWGGLQMDRGFMRAWGADMLRKYGGRFADAWTPRDQIIVAERAREVRGWQPWPSTSHACGLSY